MDKCSTLTYLSAFFEKVEEWRLFTSCASYKKDRTEYKLTGKLEYEK